MEVVKCAQWIVNLALFLAFLVISYQVRIFLGLALDCMLVWPHLNVKKVKQSYENYFYLKCWSTYTIGSSILTWALSRPIGYEGFKIIKYDFHIQSSIHFWTVSFTIDESEHKSSHQMSWLDQKWWMLATESWQP